MNVFDIIGPVMVGPSSSHTAGALRIGRVACGLLGEQLVNVTIGLYGSFYKTYKGHGTDKAIIAGLMDMLPDDERIKDSLILAEYAGIKYRVESVVLQDAHPNTAVITSIGISGKRVTVQGSSVGGGSIIINKINGMNVEFTGEYNTLVISHTDTPGTIAAVTYQLACSEINIAQMTVYRSFKGGDALMVIETDQTICAELHENIKCLPNINCTSLILHV